MNIKISKEINHNLTIRVMVVVDGWFCGSTLPFHKGEKFEVCHALKGCEKEHTFEIKKDFASAEEANHFQEEVEQAVIDADLWYKRVEGEIKGKLSQDLLILRD